MFWLRQHILPLVESFQDRERSPGAESFRSALSDGAESFYSALSDHRSSIYYDAESSDLNSSDSDSRYADVDEEPHQEQTPAVATEFEEAFTKESTLDEAYESFSYGKLFEDVYGTVVHRPPLLKRQQKHQDNKNEKQPPRKWRPRPHIPVISDSPQLNSVTCASSELPAHRKSQSAELNCYMKQEQDEQETNRELGDEILEGDKITFSFFHLEQAAEEFAEFIVDEAKLKACKFLAENSMLGNERMTELDLNNLSNDSANKSCPLGHSMIATDGINMHPVRSEDRDILDAFNRQFEPCFDSEEEPDSQVFENASEEEVDCMEYPDFDEKGLLNRNALLGTFKRFPHPALDNLHHEHSFSDSSQTGGSSRRQPASLLPATSSASKLTDTYWRRHSSGIADTATVQYNRLDLVNKNFLSSDPDISKYSRLNLSNGYADSTITPIPDRSSDVSCFAELGEKEPDPLEDANAHMQAHCLSVIYSNRLLAKDLSVSSSNNSPCELLHENKRSALYPAREDDSGLLNEQPKPPPRSLCHSGVTSPSLLKKQPKPPPRSPRHSSVIPASHSEEQPKPTPRSPRHSSLTPPPRLEEEPKPPPRSPRHSSATPPSLLEEQPKPPPRSPRHSNVGQSSQFQHISAEGANMPQGAPMEGSMQVKNQAYSDSSLCLESHMKAPTRRRRALPRPKASKRILPDGGTPQKVNSRASTEQAGKEELAVQNELQTFTKEFEPGQMCYESDVDSSLSSCEDSETDKETPFKETLQQPSFQGLEHQEHPPTCGILRLPFSLSELSRHLIEDNSPLDVVSFRVVENCDFLNDNCSGSAPYMMKLGPNDELSAFLVDRGIKEHSEMQDSDTDSVFENTFETFHDCNLDSIQSDRLPFNENHAKSDEDVEDWQSFESLSDLTKSVSHAPTRPLRKRSCPSEKNKQFPVRSMDVQSQKKIEAELTCSGTVSSEETASMMTPSVPCASQGTNTPHVQYMEESRNSMYERVVTIEEHSASEAVVHDGTDTLEACGNKSNPVATLSGCAASSPLPTSCSYQEVARAGAECDKLLPREKTTGDCFFGGRASANADSLHSSIFQECEKGDHDKLVMKAPKDLIDLIEKAPIDQLKAAFGEAFTEFYEDKQKYGGSSRGSSQPTSESVNLVNPLYEKRQALNAQSETKVPGERQQTLDKGNCSTNDLVSVLGQTAADVAELCNQKRGIQGHHNSCYLDATLFAMFSCTTLFDDILNRDREPHDIPQYEEIQKVLRDDIVNTLRRDRYVPSKNVMRLRQLLDDLGCVSGLTTEEKDPEEFLNSLFHALSVKPFLKLSSQQETHLYQLFVAKNELLEIPTVQQLFHQSIYECKLKFQRAPKALIIQMPRCGKQFKLYDYIVPSLKLDITDALEDSYRFCYVCGRQATLECWECFRPDVGLECTSYCDSCSKTVHQHKDRTDHKQEPLLIKDSFRKDAPLRREVMDLFAVVCIETSHYVCFVKCPVKNKHTWCFFDSMADREGGEDGHNIPKVDNYLDADNWFEQKGLEKLRDLSRADKARADKILPGMTRRLLSDAYMCMYENKFVKQYE
ncbi:ubiquitin carboxyl-terminal hydrolase CYLD isoform X3 [Rhipicephalus microplus]|uniref:ubiquitin carboxyl-terminal hydrolase CYLD isoform X3 n=1 Tax=Rhipicephalus microplus TaxID=6941 RepID=UPI003F6C2B9A